MEKRRIVEIFLHFWGGMWALLLLLAVSVAGAGELDGEAPPLRLGLQYGSPTYELDAEGRPQGYIIEYLKDITAITGQRFDVRLLRSEILLRELRAGRLDIACGAFPEALSADLLVSKDFLGVSRPVLYASSHNTRLHYEDFTAFPELRVGMLTDQRFAGEMFAAFAAARGLRHQNIFFDDSLQMRAELEEGGLDAALSDIQDELFSQIIGKIGVIPLHFYAASGQKALMERIDAAQRRLFEEDPFYRARIASATFGEVHGVFAQTREESAFVRGQTPLRVVCGADESLELYRDGKDGTYKGAYADLLRLVEKYSGLRFIFVQAKSNAQAVEMLMDGRADICLNALRVNAFAEERSVVFTRPLNSIHMLIVGKSGHRVSRYAAQTVAVNLQQVFLPYYLREKFPNWNIRYFDSVASCIDAVRKGICDVTLQPDNHIFDVLVGNPYADIGVISSIDTVVPVAMALRAARNPLLLSVLNKGIASISPSERLLVDARNEVVPVRFSRFWKLYKEFIQWGCLLAALLLSGLLAFFQYRIYRVAYRDGLTGLHNRNYLYGRVLRSKRGRRVEEKAVIMVEISNLRQINEHYGEEVGNRCIVFVAEALQRQMRPGSQLFRLGGDSFLLIASCDREDVASWLREQRTRMSNLRDGMISTRLEFNIGVDIVEERGDLGIAAHRANVARKKAKAGWEKLVFFDYAMKQRLNARKEIESGMRRALEQREFVVYYQAKVDMATGAFAGAEALVRWRTPEGTLREPAEFIPVFEKNGFILLLDFYVLEEACAQQRGLLERGVDPRPIAVNQSCVHVDDPEYVEKLKAVLQRYDLPGAYIELELTEYTFMEGRSACSVLADIKALGFRLAIDDFGSGYSAPTLLRELPVDILKIDKGFLDESATSSKSRAIIRHIVRMAQELRVDSVCEGVEREEQAQFLRDIGCRYGQGYLFSKPVPVEEFLHRYYDITEE